MTDALSTIKEYKTGLDPNSFKILTESLKNEMEPSYMKRFGYTSPNETQRSVIIADIHELQEQLDKYISFLNTEYTYVEPQEEEAGGGRRFKRRTIRRNLARRNRTRRNRVRHHR